MYMNKTKRNLIIASAIINLIGVTASLVLSILLKVNPPLFAKVIEYLFFISYSFNIYYVVFSFAAGVVASVFLLYSVREKGKYFRTTQGLYIAGFIIVIVCGGTLAWLLLFISMFVPDVVIMNTKSEVKQEEKEQEKEAQKKDQELEEKKQKIEQLKQLRDSGEITEEEYKKKLFDLL